MLYVLTTHNKGIWQEMKYYSYIHAWTAISSIFGNANTCFTYLRMADDNNSYLNSVLHCKFYQKSNRYQTILVRKKILENRIKYRIPASISPFYSAKMTSVRIIILRVSHSLARVYMYIDSRTVKHWSRFFTYYMKR